MKKIARVLIALTIASSAGLGALPASATECTPKGCTGGCRVNPDALKIDVRSGTIDMEPPIRCYA